MTTSIRANIIVEGDLRRNVALDIKRLVEIQSFRGTRIARICPAAASYQDQCTYLQGPKRTVANKKK